MQRLVYSPSVSAYVQTETGIIDISDYITSGTVNRVLNEVSTAELTLRNPDKRFTQPGNPTFRPMDGITIFASRYKSRPVQIFTGYLDSTPYLQLFPGTCTIRASCTLKRLLHTYWDAGLPHTYQWLEKFNWLPNPQTGTIFSGPGETERTGLQKFTNKRKEIENAIITDGSVGNLLWNVMHEIGQWDKDHILIEKLPGDIIQNVAQIMESFQEDDEEAKKELEQFYKDLIGEYSGSGGFDGAPGGDPGSVDIRGNSNAEKVFNYFADRGLPNVSAAGIVGNFMVESGCDPKSQQHGGGPGRGLAQWTYDARWQNLLAFAKKRGQSPTSMSLQLDFVWKELTESYRSVLSYLKTAPNVEGATEYFCTHYEAPGVPHIDRRLSYAREALKEFGGKRTGRPGRQ